MFNVAVTIALSLYPQPFLDKMILKVDRHFNWGHHNLWTLAHRHLLGGRSFPLSSPALNSVTVVLRSNSRVYDFLAPKYQPPEYCNR